MFKNYLKTAIRNLLRYKGFAIINISSLTIGIIGCMVIGLFVWDEWQYDKKIPGGENVYRIYEQRLDTTRARILDVAGLLLGFVLGIEYNQLETLLRRFLTDALNHRGVEWIGRT